MKANPKLLEKYKALMIEAKGISDVEIGHGTADDILCELLKELGYGEVVELYDEVLKWYA